MLIIRTIQQIEFYGMLKTNSQACTILEISKKNQFWHFINEQQKFCSAKLKSAVKNRQSLILRMNTKIFNGNNLPHELLLTTRQQIKLRNAFENNMTIWLISKIIQSIGFLGSLLGKIAGPLMKVGVPLGKNILAPLGITAVASAADAGIQRKYMVLEQQL